VNVLLVPAHPGFPGQIPQSRKTVVCVCSDKSPERNDKGAMDKVKVGELLVLEVMPMYYIGAETVLSKQFVVTVNVLR